MILINISFLCIIFSLQLKLIKSNNITLENIFAVLRNYEDDTTVLTKSILKRCLENDNVFLIHGKHDNTEIIKEASSSSKSVKLFDIKNEIFSNYTRFRKNYIFEEKHLSKKNFAPLGVIIDISTDINFTRTLVKMRNSIWWNSQAVYLLINRIPQENCDAFKYLKILWDFKILSTVYICRLSQNEVVLYTFNPFTNSAPNYWREVKIINEHWTLFKLQYRQHLIDSELCHILYFDKVKKLNNYRLKAQIPNKNDYYDGKRSNYSRCVGLSSEIICKVLAEMNVTFDVKKSAVIGSIDKNGNPQGPLRDIHREKIDIIIFGYFLRSYWKLMTYPHYFHVHYVLCLATPVTLTSKLSFFFNWNFLLTFILFCSSCIFILKNVMRKSTYSSILQFVQLALSNRCIKEPPCFYPRILLQIVIFGTSATNLLLQLHLNWFSALPKYESNMQSVEDLAKSNYTFSAQYSHKDIILQNTFIKKFEGFDVFDTCLDRLNNDEQVACIVLESILDGFSWQENPLIYKLKNPLFDRGISYIHTEDFPLSYKLNCILQRMREGGLVKFMYNKYLYNNNLHSRNFKAEKQMLEFKTINLKKFISCVYILLGGWASAVVVFLTELLIGKIKFKKK